MKPVRIHILFDSMELACSRVHYAEPLVIEHEKVLINSNTSACLHEIVHSAKIFTEPSFKVFQPSFHNQNEFIEIREPGEKSTSATRCVTLE